MSEIKNLGAFAFRNEYGWMNAMKGRKWETLVKTYQEEYKKQVSKVKDLSKQIHQELQLQPSYTKQPSLGSVNYEMRGFQTIVWHFKNSKDYHAAADIDIDENKVWSVEDESDGAEQYTLKMYENGKEKWSYDKKVGPFVAAVGKRCYVIELENFLWLRRLVSVDKFTGKDRKVELDIKDPSCNLQLSKGLNECLFLVANNAGIQRCWYRDSHSHFKELTGFESFVTVGFTGKTVCYFGRKKGSDTYTPVGCKVNIHGETPEWYNPKSDMLLTRKVGKRTIWEKGKSVLSLVANIDVDTLGEWRGEDNQSCITIQEPGSYRQEFEDYLQQKTVCAYAKSSYRFTRSKDGTSVPYILVSNCKPKHLLCVVYGAYGVSTRMNTDRWKPLLDRDWGICIALVRGGGDDTDSWAEEGRRGNKGKSIEDFEACIRAAQKQFHLGAKDTVLYGRSAGGYTVGTTLSRNTSGNLFQGVYAEVPYVDVFNTTSNPDLPLTKLEYDEFGNPRRLENAQALLSLSPIDTLPPEGAPGVFVLSRTALLDKEVYAYESVKWITKLKELDKPYKHPQPKVLAIAENEGHFSKETTGTEERANDMAIVHFWAEQNKKSHQRIYKMANTRRNNASRKRRNNVSMRKRRNNVTARKNNNATMGGKRRRSGSRKGTRKGPRRH
jgi:hypothetical protein